MALKGHITVGTNSMSRTGWQWAKCVVIRTVRAGADGVEGAVGELLHGLETEQWLHDAMEMEECKRLFRKEMPSLMSTKWGTRKVPTCARLA